MILISRNSQKKNFPITIEKINAANAKVEVSKPEPEKQKPEVEKTSREEIIKFLSEEPETTKSKKIKDDSQQ